jgi:hypothetical protein
MLDGMAPGVQWRKESLSWLNTGQMPKVVDLVGIELCDTCAKRYASAGEQIQVHHSTPGRGKKISHGNQIYSPAHGQT